MQQETAATLLIVDDEPNVIHSLIRALRNRPFQILSAHDGESALRTLESKAVDVVISDSRMPGIDGPTLLHEVESRWPEVMRILLSGYNDNSQTIKAINEGHVFRYISKPWDERMLMTSIDQALAHQHLERDRARLQTLTKAQNEALQEANAKLEARVAERTAELVKAAERLKFAHDELKRAYVTATEVFSSLLNQRLPRSRKTNQTVIQLVREFCKVKNYSQKFINDLVMAAAMYNLGKLTWNDAMIALPPEIMERDQRLKYREYPLTGERLLTALEPAQEAATIIRHHQERWDGAGFPDNLAGDAIPLGSRILKMAVDFIEMEMGMVFARKVPREDMLINMPKYAGRLYDPTLCFDFVEMIKRLDTEAHKEDDSVVAHTTATIEPDMIVARNLHTQDGMLLLREGTIMTKRLIQRLHDFEENEALHYTIYVQRPTGDEEGGDAP